MLPTGTRELIPGESTRAKPRHSTAAYGLWTPSTGSSFTLERFVCHQTPSFSFFLGRGLSGRAVVWTPLYILCLGGGRQASCARVGIER